MIITGGTLRGRKLHVPPGDRTRPTPARVKEALFSILREHIEGSRVLDMFAGSGALGFESVSRGAKHAVFIEAHAPTAVAIREAAERFGITSQCTVISARAERSLKRLTGPFDLVFADPPYAFDPPLELFAELIAGGFLSEDAVIAYEHPAGQPTLDLPNQLELWREDAWGEVAFRFLRLIRGGAAV